MFKQLLWRLCLVSIIHVYPYHHCSLMIESVYSDLLHILCIALAPDKRCRTLTSYD
jgi:hypothetical protein